MRQIDIMILQKQKTKLTVLADPAGYLAAGFTLIELLVVISIMVLLSTILIVNYNGQRGIRNLKIAQNQLATNIRKTQSFMLSSRDVSAPNGAFTPAKYYALKLDKNSNQYVIESIDSNYVINSAMETVALPQGIIMSNISVVTGGVADSPTTAHLAYGAPYAKLYVYSANDSSSNSSCLNMSFLAAAQNPGCVLSLGDRQVVVTLRDSNSSATKSITVYGVSGKVESSP